MNTSDRYQGKPFLRLLELYVLKAIGKLPDSSEANLRKMQPNLAEEFGFNGSWDEIVAAAMEFPPNMPQLIVQMWQRNQEIAKCNNLTLSEQQFAELFVDKNFPP